MIPDDQGLAEEIWRAQRAMEEDLPAVSDGKTVEPLTYAKFLECLDKRRHDNYKRPECASVNKRTLLFLINDIGVQSLGTGDCTIHGVDMYIDEHLPDHAIKIDGVLYNAPKESSEDPRDTQFAGFAEMLVRQFDGLSMRYKDWPDWRELDRQMKLAIAQRAYDLVEHALERAPVIEFTIAFVQCRPQSMRVGPGDLTPRMCPGHPETTIKHDGKLDTRNASHVEYIEVAGKPGILIENDRDWVDACIRLNIGQALSLRDWLVQESPKLEQLIEAERTATLKRQLSQQSEESKTNE